MFKIAAKIIGAAAATLMVLLLAVPLLMKKPVEAEAVNPIPPITQVIPLSMGKYYPLVRLTDTDGKFFCSGSVISDNLVLTAAHCLNGSPLNIQSNDKQQGKFLNVPAMPIMANPRADYGLVTGNFTKFGKLQIQTDPYLDLAYHKSEYASCGSPWGSVATCFPFQAPLTKTFDCFKTQGQLYPGMSGGPVVDLKTGVVVAINSAVSADGIIVCPLVGLYESIGR